VNGMVSRLRDELVRVYVSSKSHFCGLIRVEQVKRVAMVVMVSEEAEE